MFSTYPPIPHAEELIEVIDASDKPFLLMPKAEVLRQGLPHRGVVVAVRSGKKRILVSKQALANADGTWELSAHTRIRAGESRLDAALRALSRHESMDIAQLHYAASKASNFPATTLFERQHITLYIADIATAPNISSPSQETDRMFLDKDELQGMSTHFPEMLSPVLLWAVKSAALFSPIKHKQM